MSAPPINMNIRPMLFEPLDRMASPPGSSIWLRELQVSSLMYASPAWWGFTDASERSRLNRLIAGLIRAGLLPTDFPTFEELAPQADTGLFRAICSNPDHVLRHYFTPKNHPAIICVRVLTFSIFHPRTLGTLSHALFTEHCHRATATQ